MQFNARGGKTGTGMVFGIVSTSVAGELLGSVIGGVFRAGVGEFTG